MIIPLTFRVDPADPKVIEQKVLAITAKLGPVAAALIDDGFQVEFVADNVGRAITVSVIVTAFTFEVATA